MIVASKHFFWPLLVKTALYLFQIGPERVICSKVVYFQANNVVKTYCGVMNTLSVAQQVLQWIIGFKNGQALFGFSISYTIKCLY